MQYKEGMKSLMTIKRKSICWIYYLDHLQEHEDVQLLNVFDFH